MDGLTEGRIVHYVMPNGEHRPAIVVRVWRVQDYKNGQVVGLPHPPENGCCQLHVFTDGTNDVYQTAPDGEPCNSWVVQEAAAGIMWASSVLYSQKPEPRTWHWIEKA
jgi:hypothetical protein